MNLAHESPTGQQQRFKSDEDLLPPFPEAHPGPERYTSSHHEWQGRGAATDPDYARWRDERLREFDADYEDWCRERYARFCSEFDDWRRSQQRTAADSRLKLGARDDGAPTEEPATFFERA